MLLESLRCRLYDKYRPTSIQQMVVSPHTRIKVVQAFLANPYPSAWLFTGGSGLGKTSLARIMASQLAKHPVCIRNWAGNDVDLLAVREMELEASTPTIFGGWKVEIVNEADAISDGAAIRLLPLLENLRYTVLVFTANTLGEKIDARLKSRFIQLPFSGHGLAAPATKWLQDIALKEGINLSENDADNIVRSAKSNLRECLTTLEAMVLGRTPCDPGVH